MPTSASKYPEISPEYFLKLLSGECRENKSGKDDLVRRVEHIKSTPGSDAVVAESEFYLISSTIDRFSSAFHPVVCNRLIMYIEDTNCLSGRATANLLMERIIGDNDLPNNGRAILFEHYLREYVNTLDNKKYKNFVKNSCLKTFSKLEHSMPLLYVEICLLSGHFDKAEEIIAAIAEDQRSHVDILTQVKTWLSDPTFKENTLLKKWVNNLAHMFKQAFRNSDYASDLDAIFELNGIRTGPNVFSMSHLKQKTAMHQV